MQPAQPVRDPSGYPPPSYPLPGQPGYPQPVEPVYPPPAQPVYPHPVPQGSRQPKQQAQWMVRPSDIPGCPPGLEYLSQIDQLLVQQQVELLEVFTDWETSNRYVIKNSVGQQVYFAAEESDTCHRQLCGSDRGFTMHITDNLNQEVIRVNRQFQCCAGCSWCANYDSCAMVVTVEAPPGNVVGTIRQEKSFCAPKYSIMDESGKAVLRIQGPTCVCPGPFCVQDQDFVVYTPDMQHNVGKISKQWSGLFQEFLTTATNFGIRFPMDLDVRMKACMIGALFLIDFMYFEEKDKGHSD